MENQEEDGAAVSVLGFFPRFLSNMWRPKPGSASSAITILDVLRVDLCARAILGHVPVKDLARSERVCKRWQRAVHHYLQGCRDLSFMYSLYHENYYPVLRTGRRTIFINRYSIPQVIVILEKWGPSLRSVITEHIENVYAFLYIIAEKCLNLEEIEIFLPRFIFYLPPLLHPIENFKKIKRIVLKNYGLSETATDAELANIFLNSNCKNISIYGYKNFNGSFLKCLKPNVLESLHLQGCLSLRIEELLSAVHNLRKVTSLALNDSSSVHLLLNEMPQLEDLKFYYGYSENHLVFNIEEAIAGFSSLVNLKRLTMYGPQDKVCDRFLEALAQGCSKLEYLEIRGLTTSITARGVAALCRGARTTLHVYTDCEDDQLLTHYFEEVKVTPLYQELAALGCVQMSPEWFVAASRDPRGRELNLGRTAAQPEGLQRELKLKFF